MKSSNSKIEYQSKLKKYHKTKDNKHQRTKAQTLKRSTAKDFEVVILEFRSHDPGVLSFKLTCYKIRLSANNLIPLEFWFPTMWIATWSRKLVALQQWNVQSQYVVPLQSIFSPRMTANPNEPQRLSLPCSMQTKFHSHAHSPRNIQLVLGHQIFSCTKDKRSIE